MSFAEKLALFTLLLATLIFVHELGHYLAARLFKVKVLRFSFGFGPKLLGFTWGETEYWLSAIPFGGYVKMAGEDPTEEAGEGDSADPDRGRGFLEQAPWKRAVISAAGPFMSLTFPILICFFAFYFTATELSSRVGYAPADRPAYAAGIRAGDRIVEVDGKPTRSFLDLTEAVSPVWERPLSITVERKGELRRFSVTPELLEEESPIESLKRGAIGVMPAARAPVISVTSPQSPAGKAGLATFDRITDVDGQPVATFAELEELLAARSAGANATITVKAMRTRPPEEKSAPPKKAPPAQEEVTATLAPVEGAEGLAAYGLGSSDLALYSVKQGSPAFEAGMRKGDQLLSIDGEALAGRHAFQVKANRAGEQPIRVAWLHEGEQREATMAQRFVTLTDEFGNSSKSLLFGVAFDLRLESYVEGEMIPSTLTFGKALARAFEATASQVRQTAITIGALFTGQLSFKNVGSLITVYDITVRSAEMGWSYFLQMMGFISVNLGLMNLLPIPILDGFGILTAGVETVRRRPMSLRARTIAAYVGLVMVVGLMIMALRNDIVRYFFTNSSGE